MRIITFMKMINCNGWAPRNKVPYEWIAPIPITNSYAWSAPVPITNPLITDNKLFYNFYLDDSRGGTAWFYYRLLYFDEDY
jgi:hypothetical protein